MSDVYIYLAWKHLKTKPKVIEVWKVTSGDRARRQGVYWEKMYCRFRLLSNRKVKQMQIKTLRTRSMKSGYWRFNDLNIRTSLSLKRLWCKKSTSYVLDLFCLTSLLSWHLKGWIEFCLMHSFLSIFYKIWLSYIIYD